MNDSGFGCLALFWSLVRERERERERDLREETVYCSPAWDCGKGSAWKGTQHWNCALQRAKAVVPWFHVWVSWVVNISII